MFLSFLQVLNHRCKPFSRSYLVDNQYFRRIKQIAYSNIPVIPVPFLRVFQLSILYITVYISISYIAFRNRKDPSLFNWNNWNWNDSVVITYLLFVSSSFSFGSTLTSPRPSLQGLCFALTTIFRLIVWNYRENIIKNS